MYEQILQEIDTLINSCQKVLEGPRTRRFSHTDAFGILKRKFPALIKISKPGERNFGSYKLVAKLKQEDNYVIKVGSVDTIKLDKDLYAYASKHFPGYFAKTYFGVNTEVQVYGNSIPDLKIWHDRIETIKDLAEKAGIIDIYEENLKVYNNKLLIIDARLMTSKRKEIL